MDKLSTNLHNVLSDSQKEQGKFNHNNSVTFNAFEKKFMEIE